MKRSTDRILTTHTGSLPRPMDLAAMLEALDSGEPPDRETFQTRVRGAVAEVVQIQVEAGVLRGAVLNQNKGWRTATIPSVARLFEGAARYSNLTNWSE